MNDPFDKALYLIEDCIVWQQVTTRLEEHGLIAVLGPAGLEKLSLAWQRNRARDLKDEDLIIELRHWAEGGDYDSHLAGFQAIAPARLVEEAERRGWFVRLLPGGRAVVNPPRGKPLMLNTL